MSFHDPTRGTTGFLRGPTGDEPNTTKGGRATAGAYGPIKCGQVAGAAEGSATVARDTESAQDPGAHYLGASPTPQLCGASPTRVLLLPDTEHQAAIRTMLLVGA